MVRAVCRTYRKYLENRGFRPKHDLNVSMTVYTVTFEPFGPTTAGYWYVRAGKDLDKRLRGCTQKTVIEKLGELGRLDYFVEHHQERIAFHELNVEF